MIKKALNIIEYAGNFISSLTGNSLVPKDYVDGKVAEEAALREAAEQVLAGGIDDETDARIAADNALQTAINTKQNALGYTAENIANKGQANGYVPLGGDTKIPSAYLPSYVDDVIEVATFGSLPLPGESGKIYVTIDTNFEYRWSGSTYIRLVASPGTTDALIEGVTNLYFTAIRVLAVVLAGLSTATNSTILSTDTLIVALGKLQAQINFLGTSKQDVLGFTPVPVTRSVIAGTAMTGGGNLTADRTLNVNLGTSSNSACAGNDPRLNDIRYPRKLAFSYGDITAPNNTNEVCVASILIPAGTAASTDSFFLYYLLTRTLAGGSNITVTARLSTSAGIIGNTFASGSIIGTFITTTSGASIRAFFSWVNKSSLSLQEAVGANTGGIGQSGAGNFMAAINNANDWYVVLTITKATAGNTAILNQYELQKQS